MYISAETSRAVKTNTNHHEAAAERHEEAAVSHRQAAAFYAYGDYQQANEQAKLARDSGLQAKEECTRAME